MTPEEKKLFTALTSSQLMALTIYGESEGEKFAGKLAVGFVIKNRATLWKKSIADVCLARNQFECFNDRNARLPLLVRIAKEFNFNATAFHHCCLAAEGVMNTDLPSNVGRATFYKASGCKSPWFDKVVVAGKLVKVAEVGRHEFYEERKVGDKPCCR